MIHLFIDTNVFLTFYSFAPDDLEELRKLRVAIESGELTLWTTEQIKQEFQRNRETQVARALEALTKMDSNQSAPHVVRNLEGYEEMMVAKRDLSQRLNALSAQVKQQFLERSLVADQVFEEIFELAESIPVTDEIMEAARRRTDIGNPPGKKGSMGDAINWECLLGSGPEGEDLYFVTDDKDFRSDISPERLKDFLAVEWQSERSSEIFLHRRIATFFAEKYPEISLASDLERQLQVDALVNSSSFDDTHLAISRLTGFADFTNAQIDELIEAAIHNSQIRWIAQDRDVHDFFQRLLEANSDRLDPLVIARFNRYFNPSEAGEGPAAADAF
jgi:hypothetical protein